MDLGRSISSTLLHSPIMLTMKTIDAVTTVTLLAMLKITRLYIHWQSIGQAQYRLVCIYIRQSSYFNRNNPSTM